MEAVNRGLYYRLMRRRFSSLLPKVFVAGVKSSWALWVWIFGTGVSAAGIALVYGNNSPASSPGAYSLGFVKAVNDPAAFVAYVNAEVTALKDTAVEVALHPPKDFKVSYHDLDRILQESAAIARANPTLEPAQISKSILENLINPHSG